MAPWRYRGCRGVTRTSKSHATKRNVSRKNSDVSRKNLDASPSKQRVRRGKGKCVTSKRFVTQKPEWKIPKGSRHGHVQILEVWISYFAVGWKSQRSRARHAEWHEATPGWQTNLPRFYGRQVGTMPAMKRGWELMRVVLLTTLIRKYVFVYIDVLLVCNSSEVLINPFTPKFKTYIPPTFEREMYKWCSENW